MIWLYGSDHPPRSEKESFRASQTCGLFHCPLEEAVKLWPEIPWEDAETEDGIDYTVDIKRHMLMPGQYPCIPNWHQDFIPRDENLNLQPDRITPHLKMFLWLSDAPLTEFRDGRTVLPKQWVTFTQLDEHRGTQATEHGWRTFVRIVPTALCPIAPPEEWIRLHTQVYLDANNFTW